MARVGTFLIPAACFALILCAAVLNFSSNHHNAPSNLSIALAHGNIAVLASSFAPLPSAQESSARALELAEIRAIAASVTEADAHALSDEIFEKSKFSLLGSHYNGSSAYFSTRKLNYRSGDKQFFVQFSISADIYTLVALAKFTGRPLVSHVQDDLYLAIGGDSFAVRARQFPGVVWVQERISSDKVGSSLKLLLDRQLKQSVFSQLRSRLFPGATLSKSEPIVTLIVQCWHDACGAAAALVHALCPDVYVYAELLEVICASGTAERAVALLAGHVGVEHIDVKQRMEHKDFAGSAILGTGPSASSISESKVLTNIDVSGSVVGLADTGINMNNCYFYDSSKNTFPYAGSRVLKQYTYQSCSSCGRCCGSFSPSGCTDSLNSCGNSVDESGHGTHVAGIIAGNAGTAATISMGNGIASGAKLFFQDIENRQPAATCFSTTAGACDGLFPGSDLAQLFQPAYDAGVRVHSNSWGCGSSSVDDPFACKEYSEHAKTLDAFVYSKKDFLVLIAAGNDGRNAFSKTVGAPGTCKNCLVVGATQLSDALFRGMKPLLDAGWHCQYSTQNCCSNRNSCVQTSDTVSPCCSFTSVVKMSLPCCPTQYSSNLRHPYNVATFSSRGTTFDDGRIKPDLVAPGEDILSAQAPGVDGNGNLIATTPGYCGIPSSTSARSESDMNQRAAKTLSGTSMATPLAAGGVEKIRQYFVQGYYPLGIKGGAQIVPEESLLRAVILASAKPLSSGGVWNKYPFESGFARFSPISSSNIPDIFGGFGMPVLDDAVTMPGGSYKMFYTSETFFPSTGPSAFTIACSGQSIPVTLVLAWTDPAGSSASKKQLVNDLDLIVLVPGASPPQLFGNMRSFADQSNNVERTICGCPSAGSITAIVVANQTLKTSSQKWYLVANGPVTQAITKLSSVPVYKSGRIDPPASTTTSCTFSSRISLTLYFLPGKAWSGASTDWGLQLKYQEFAAALSSFARVNFQAVNVALISSSQGTAALSLGCSTVFSSYSAMSVEYITASSLLNSIKWNCGLPNSVCTTDPVLSVFNWTSFASGSVPPAPPPSPPADACSSFSSCDDCTSATSCGWCPLSATCKTGSSSSSDDGVCATSATWYWFISACSPSPTPAPGPAPAPAPAPPPASLTSSFVFRIAGFEFSAWTPADTEGFRNAIQSLLKDPASIVRILGVRAGSVIVDTEVTVASPAQASTVNAIFTNAAVIKQVPLYGESMSVVAVSADSQCKAFKSSAACTASAGCGWCLKVASCMTGTKEGATVPTGSSSTCSGSDWEFASSSCASLYYVGTVCFLGLPAVALYVLAGAGVVHVLQALLYLCWSRSKGFFTCGKFLFASLVPVIGWSVWCLSKQKKRSEDHFSMATFVPPPSTAAALWSAHQNGGPPARPPPMAVYGQPSYGQPSYGQPAMLFPSAPPLDSSQTSAVYTPRGRVVLANPND